MASDEEVTPILKLPPEMTVSILDLLGSAENRNSRFVCRQWRQIIDHPYSRLINLMNLIYIEDEASAQALFNSHFQFKAISFYGVKMEDPILNDSQEFPDTQELHLAEDNSEALVLSILRHGCEFIQSLMIGNYSFAEFEDLSALSIVFSENHWSNLSKLLVSVYSHLSLIFTVSTFSYLHNRLTISEIHADRSGQIAGEFDYGYGDHELLDLNLEHYENIHVRTQDHMAGVERFFHLATIPTIQTLNFTLDSGQEETAISPNTSQLVQEFSGFLERHAKNLKRLKISYTFRQQKPFKIRDNPLPENISSERHLAIARTLNLDYFRLVVSHFDLLLCLVPPCLLRLERLTNFAWRPRQFHLGYGDEEESSLNIDPIPDAKNPLQSLIKNIQNTLVELEIIHTFNHHSELKFELAWLANCSKLRRLSIIPCDIILNLDVQLPQVTFLKIFTGPAKNFFKDGVNLVCQSFKNLETILISSLLSIKNEISDWVIITSLLDLPKIQEIQFEVVAGCYHNFSTVIEKSIREICQKKKFNVISSNNRSELNINITRLHRPHPQ